MQHSCTKNGARGAGPDPSAEAALAAAGLRRTGPRLAVLRALFRARRPLAHAELAARAALGGLDRVTIYRVLAALRRAGLVHEVRGVDGTLRFGWHPGQDAHCPGDHAHFLCLRCGGMQCLSEQPMPRVAVPRGARVQGKQLLAYGTCARCLPHG
ncbi:MAG TPA: transcriptional repressor [Myxococcota bacterium]|nr:transcriptional repressor [Myxococcota bacterium]HRY96217.1 transcriptional repressor [Myxococcota bacterium]HSA22166.1 transcriptional repressor [Myxococcota bacterium]